MMTNNLPARYLAGTDRRSVVTSSLRALFVGFSILTIGCFHTTVSTGVVPSHGVILKRGWEPGWFWGLIGPNVVNTSGACKHGVAIVETERSFGNQLASLFTLGIYAPMSITVTCAAAAH